MWIKKLGCLLASVWIGMSCPAFAEEQPQKFEGFNLQGYSDSGQKAWDVKGSTADVMGQEIKISNVDANSYGENKMNITAETGFINQTDGKMRLEKDVVVTSENGAQLVTDSLEWDKQKDLVKTKDDVFFTDDGMMVKGTGMEAQPGLKSATIEENVTVTVDPDKVKRMDQNESETTRQEDPGMQGVVTITCDGPMVIDQTNSRAEFRDNVVATQNDKTFKADLLELEIDAATNQIKSMTGTGNVVVIQGENKSYSEKLVYDALTKKLQLIGRPKLIMHTQGENAFPTSGN